MLTSCSVSNEVDYRDEMRAMVIGIHDQASLMKDDFIIIPQNGLSLITSDEGQLFSAYIAVVDAFAQESLFVGYDGDNEITPGDETTFLMNYIKIIKENATPMLVVHYTDQASLINEALELSNSHDLISVFAERSLSELHTLEQRKGLNVTNDEVTSVSDVKSVLYLINPENFEKDQLIDTLSETSYDMIIIDAFDNHEKALTSEEISILKTKANGSSRLVIAYMSIGEAEDYRWYFKDEWLDDAPDWLQEENPNWLGNYKVDYWHEDWQQIIFKGQDSYLSSIIDAGFDGVYLDIIDAYEYYENKE